MAEWGVRRRVAYLKGNNHQVESSIKNEDEVEDSKDEVLRAVAEDSSDEVLRAVKSEPLEIPELKRRKCTDSRSKDVQVTLRAGKRQHGRGPMKRNDIIGGRWCAERYKRAEESLFNVLEARDATFAQPITRTDLRLAARRQIGDTGLIDHLLKHIDGTIGPCGSKRIRRWFNHNGIMEYWLESAELADIRKEAGYHPYWFPQGCGPSEHVNSSGELMLLKAEVDKMKSNMQELLVSKKQEKDQTNMEDLVKWKAQIEESLKLNLGSWKGIEDKLGEFMIWKASVEQQVVEFTNATTNMQVEKQHTATNLVASERWEEWLDSNVDNFQGNELVPWFESTIPVNSGEEVMIQHPHSAPPDGSKTGDGSSQEHIFTAEEMVELERERDVPRLEWETQTNQQANATPNSSATASSKSDVDNLHLFQEMLQELFSWKSHMEQKVSELSNSLSALKQTSKLYAPAFQLPEDGNLSMDYNPCYKF